MVSFVNRSLGAMRGFHVFMRALPKLQKLRPKAQVIIVGNEGGYVRAASTRVRQLERGNAYGIRQ